MWYSNKNGVRFHQKLHRKSSPIDFLSILRRAIKAIFTRLPRRYKSFIGCRDITLVNISILSLDTPLKFQKDSFPNHSYVLKCAHNRKTSCHGKDMSVCLITLLVWTNDFWNILTVHQTVLWDWLLRSLKRQRTNAINLNHQLNVGYNIFKLEKHYEYLRILLNLERV